MSESQLIEWGKKRLAGAFGYIVILICLLLLISLSRTIKNVLDAGERVDKAKAKVLKLKEENEKLKLEAEKVQSEEFIEKQLRDKLGLAKEGEIVLVLPDADTLKKLSPQIPEEKETLPDPTWKKWLKLFL